MLEMKIPVKIVTKLVVHSKGLVAVLVLLCLKAFFARESELLPSRLLLFFGNGLLLLSYWNENTGFLIATCRLFTSLPWLKHSAQVHKCSEVLTRFSF